MDNAIAAVGYVADAVLAYLRSGNRPSETEARELNRLPMIDLLRQRVTKDDLSWLFDAIDLKSGEAAAFYVSLLRAFAHEAEVQNHLRNLWETTDSILLRENLLWQILNDPQLPREWHERLFQFVLENWETFQKNEAAFLGTTSVALENILRRLGDSSFPATKKWAYLCCVPVATKDAAAAIALVSLGCLLPDPFTRYVAAILLNRIG